MKHILLVGLLASSAALAGCVDDGYQTLSVDEWKAAYESTPDAFLLDVRTQGEYAEAHLTGATLVPYDVLEQNQGMLPEDKDAPIFVYCRSGSRSAIASQTLVEMGYTNVHNMEGGINDWISSGYPVE